MKSIIELKHSGVAMLSTLRLWLVFGACFGAAAVLIAALQRVSDVYSTMGDRAAPPASRAAQAAGIATPDRTTVPRALFAPTFADAAASLRAGRHADAYGRFVTLADDGDVDAACIALLMHRYGPDVFGSAWDASDEQLAAWRRLAESRAPETERGAGATADGSHVELSSVLDQIRIRMRD